MPPKVQTLWDELNPTQQTLVTQLMAALAGKATSPVADDLAALFAAWEAEDAALTSEEITAAEAEWRDIQAALNANRAPEPPLFP